MRTLLIVVVICTVSDLYGQIIGPPVFQSGSIVSHFNDYQSQIPLRQSGLKRVQTPLRKGKLWIGSTRSMLDTSYFAHGIQSAKMVQGKTLGNDMNWDDRFGYLGVGYEYSGGQVIAVAAGPGNTLLVGGSFLTIACNNGRIDTISNIASWDGTTWSSLDGGVNGAVDAICVNGNDVYVGGTFTMAGHVTVSNIARWDGSAWHSVGTSAQFYLVNAITAIGTNLYVGGMGGAGNIARWNGSTWSPLGSGINGTVYAIQIAGSDIYVGGSFSTAGNITVNGIAKWNGTSWSVLNGGVLINDSTYHIGGAVYSLQYTSQGLFAGGYFNWAGQLAANSIALWNGTQWSALGSGVSNQDGTGAVKALCQSAGNIFVGGDFTGAGNIRAYGVASFNINSEAWDSLGYGVNYPASAVCTIGSSIYFGGSFTSAQYINARNVARWDILSKSWFPIGTGGNSGVDDYLNAIAYSSGSIFAGGWMYSAGGVLTNHVGEWNISTGKWSALGPGVYSGDPNMDSPVFTIAPDGDDIYVGGGFAYAGNIPVYGIARWNRADATWDSLGYGVYSQGGITNVRAIAIDGDDVYCAGSFTEAGYVAANNIARWNKPTNTWYSLGIGLYGPAYAVAVDSTYVYVGGAFSMAGGIPVNNIARWNKITQAWSQMGNGIWGGVYIPVVGDIAVNTTDVYIGGRFDSAGTISAGNIAKWNKQTETWTALGTGFPMGGQSQISALKLCGKRLYVGGIFSSVNSVPAKNIARYDIDIDSWSALGSGINGNVNDIDVNGSDVFAAGAFYQAGGKASFGIAHYHNDLNDSLPNSIEKVAPSPKLFTLDQNYPNPFNLNTVISYTVSQQSHVTLSIFDRFGKEVEVLVNNVEEPGYKSLLFNGSKLLSGIYYYRLQAGSYGITKKLVLLK